MLTSLLPSDTFFLDMLIEFSLWKKMLTTITTETLNWVVIFRKLTVRTDVKKTAEEEDSCMVVVSIPITER